MLSEVLQGVEGTLANEVKDDEEICSPKQRARQQHHVEVTNESMKTRPHCRELHRDQVRRVHVPGRNLDVNGLGCFILAFRARRCRWHGSAFLQNISDLFLRCPGKTKDLSVRGGRCRDGSRRGKKQGGRFRGRGRLLAVLLLLFGALFRHGGGQRGLERALIGAVIVGRVVESTKKAARGRRQGEEVEVVDDDGLLGS